MDPGDITDADVFEVLTEHNVIRPRVTVPTRNQHAVDDTTPELQVEQTTYFNIPNAETSSMVVIDHFPLGKAGAPIAGTARELNEDMAAQSVWAPFVSQYDWQVANWAKMRGPTSSAVTDLLAIGEVCVLFNPTQIRLLITNLSLKIVDKLGLSYRTVKQLNDIVDNKLLGRPPFQCKELSIGNERLEFYCRDAMECIRSLYGDPRFAQDLIFTPERHYTSTERVHRIYNEIHTADWWWSVQVCNQCPTKYPTV